MPGLYQGCIWHGIQIYHCRLANYCMKLFSIYNRINLTVMAILFVLTAGSYYLMINRIFVHELDEELNDYKHKIEVFAKRYGKAPEPGALEDLRVLYEPVTKASGDVRYDLVRKFDPEEKEMENFCQLIYTQAIGDQFYKVTIEKPVEGIRLLTKTIVYATIARLLNQIVLKRLWRPFYNSIQAIKTFKLRGGDIPKLPPTRIDEFSFLNDSLSQTMESAKTEYRILKEFTENASHEVQTPLAIIRSKLDLLIQEENLSEKQVELLTGVYGAVKRISRLNQSLLLLAKIENHQYAVTGPINLKTVISDKLDQFREFWNDNRIQISSHLEESLINANADLIDVLLNNLLSNAGLHNRKNGKINIHLKSDQLMISNTGSLHELDKERLFSRFYKQAMQSPHNGLGLSIIKQICDQSNIHVQYSFDGIFHRFTLTWVMTEAGN